MARQVINIGSSANDGTGDPLRTAFDKINDNFVELYGGDNDINTLDANLDVNNFAITTGRTNGDITVTPNGTGSIKLGAVKFKGTTISSDDSTIININEGLVVDGTASISGAATLSTSLALASGATVTSILDEDAMGSNSATALATQQSIKAYVDSQVTAQDLDFTADDSSTNSIDLDSEVMQFSGDTGITTSATGNTVSIAIDGTVATLTGSQTFTNKVLTNPTINAATMTGAVAINGITLNDNTIVANASNSDLELDGSGSGIVKVLANAEVVGTLTTADIANTNNITTTQLDADGVRIKDNKVATFASNANLELSANGSGVVDVQNAMTTVGQTVTGNVAITGQADIDNVRINGNTISTTNSNGGLTFSPNGTGTITMNAGTVTMTSAFVGLSTALVNNTLFMGNGSKIQANSTNEDVIIESNGTGSVILDQVSITDNAITTHVSNADLKIGTDGTGSIDLTTGNITRTGDLDFNVSGNILLDADGGTVFLQDNGTSYAQLLRSGSNDLTIASGSTQAIIFTGANAAFQGALSVAGGSTLDGVTITDNTIKSNASNADLQIGTSGTGVIDLLTATQSTVGSAGGASALPGQPTGYIKVKIGGTMRVIPFYDES